MYLHRLAPPVAAALLFSSEEVAHAGMPAVHLTEVASVRLSVVSFFLMGLLLSATAILLIWNWLANDFTWLPRLTFAKACAVVTLWGLLFVVVLTMISGARELLTPGAWRKVGLTYELDEPKQQPIVPDVAAIREHQLRSRRTKLERLSAAVQRYAVLNDGMFPETLEALDSNETWDVPGFPGTAYILLPLDSSDDEPQPIVREPEVFEDGPLVLLTSGEVMQETTDDPDASTVKE